MIFDRLARIAASINPYSWSAALIGLACLASATLFRFVAGWASSDLRFSIYLPAILATGLLAGAPAAIAVGIASILIVIWAFIPPILNSNGSTPVNNSICFLMPCLTSSLFTLLIAVVCRVVEAPPT